MTNDVSFFAAIGVVIGAFVPFLLPGSLIVSARSFKDILFTGVRVIGWSMSAVILGTFFASAMNLHVFWGFAVASGFGVAMFLLSAKKGSRPSLWHLLSIILFLLLVTALFAAPFALKYQLLPTGDSQKAIYWGERVLALQSLPDYQISELQLNRDPVDFFTPGLHTLVAFLMSISPLPLTTIGLFSLVAAAAVAWIAAAITKELMPNRSAILLLLSAAFVLTHFRFLRYIREPGYHLQNLIGELLLFALIAIALRLLKKWSWADAALALCIALALPTAHQFSTFIAAFALIPLGVALVYNNRKIISAFFWRHLVLVLGTLTAMIVAIFLLGLAAKIPHIFTITPHLAPLTPDLIDYPLTMGITWTLFALFGVASRLKQGKQNTPIMWGFLGSVGILLLLSQGPRIFIDIPPVRALFYSIVPLSIMAAIGVTQLFQIYRRRSTLAAKFIITPLLIALVVVPMWLSVMRAYATSSTATRTNSTYTPELALTTSFLKTNSVSGAVLIDDYNKRAASWLLLSGRPMYARIGADLERQMNEASQSEGRMRLYLRQLDYEKIFALGSRPELVDLLDKNGITFLTGIEKSSATSFDQNPSLDLRHQAGDVSLYRPTTESDCAASKTCTWLLRESTLVNDIGDREDTFEHLQASIRTSRLSDPQSEEGTTFRVTSAPEIPLAFNVGDFVRILWDQENTNTPDTALELLIEWIGGPNELTIRTPANTSHTITSGVPIRIESHEAQFDERGFLTFVIENSKEQEISLDFIALGLAHVP